MCAFNLLDARTRSNKVPEVFPPPFDETLSFLFFFPSGETPQISNLLDLMGGGEGGFGGQVAVVFSPLPRFLSPQNSGTKALSCTGDAPRQHRTCRIHSPELLGVRVLAQEMLAEHTRFYPTKCGGGGYAAVSFLPNYAHITGLTSASVFSQMTIKQFYKSI